MATPVVEPSPVTAYVVTPYVGATALRPVRFSSTATSQIVGGLTNGIAHTFQVKAINALGNESASSARSEPAVPGQQVSRSATRTCALADAGAVKCWGRNEQGQVGNGGFSTTPVAVVGL